MVLEIVFEIFKNYYTLRYDIYDFLKKVLGGPWPTCLVRTHCALAGPCYFSTKNLRTLCKFLREIVHAKNQNFWINVDNVRGGKKERRKKIQISGGLRVKKVLWFIPMLKKTYIPGIDPQTAQVFGSFWQFLAFFCQFFVFWYSIQTGFLFLDMSGCTFWFTTASFWHPEK